MASYPQDETNATNTVIGIVFGVVLLLVLLCVGSCCMKSRRKKRGIDIEKGKPRRYRYPPASGRYRDPGGGGPYNDPPEPRLTRRPRGPDGQSGSTESTGLPDSPDSSYPSYPGPPFRHFDNGATLTSPTVLPSLSSWPQNPDSMEETASDGMTDNTSELRGLSGNYQNPRVEEHQSTLDGRSNPSEVSTLGRLDGWQPGPQSSTIIEPPIENTVPRNRSYIILPQEKQKSSIETRRGRPPMLPSNRIEGPLHSPTTESSDSNHDPRNQRHNFSAIGSNIRPKHSQESKRDKGKRPIREPIFEEPFARGTLRNLDYPRYPQNAQLPRYLGYPTAKNINQSTNRVPIYRRAIEGSKEKLGQIQDEFDRYGLHDIVGPAAKNRRQMRSVDRVGESSGPQPDYIQYPQEDTDYYLAPNGYPDNNAMAGPSEDKRRQGYFAPTAESPKGSEVSSFDGRRRGGIPQIPTARLPDRENLYGMHPDDAADLQRKFGRMC